MSAQLAGMLVAQPQLVGPQGSLVPVLKDGVCARVTHTDIGILEKLETTARYTRVATGLISKIESPLDGLSVPRRRRARPDTEEPPTL